MTPTFTLPIETFEDVIRSGIPWSMATYGTVGDSSMEKDQDPVIRTIWRDKINVPYSGDPDVRSHDDISIPYQREFKCRQTCLEYP